MSETAALTTMAGRCIRLSSRNIDALVTSLMLPVMLMLVFVYLFGARSRRAPNTSRTSSPA